MCRLAYPAHFTHGQDTPTLQDLRAGYPDRRLYHLLPMLWTEGTVEIYERRT